MGRQRVDEGDLLCERCGYALEGLRRYDPCPECGRPIEQSCPERRIGSPWQQGARFGVWRNLCALLRHPLTTFDRVRVDEKGARRLEADSIAWASLLFALFISVRVTIEAIDDPGGARTMALIFLVVPVLSFLIYALVLLMLTSIERRGIRFFGRMRRRRITAAIAETIVAHACVGWMISSLLIWLAWPTGSLIAWIAREHAWARWELILLAPTLLPWLGFFTGLLFFETLVAIGVRRMRFANIEGAQARLLGESSSSLEARVFSDPV